MVLVSPSKPEESAPIAILGGKALIPHLNAKCLGYWWSWDLSASKAVDEAIKKARRAFFAFGAMGAFQGQLNPVSTRSIYETCVVPVLLYWILTDSMLHQLKSFQGEIGRRMLKLSKYHSTLSTRLAGLQSLQGSSYVNSVFCQRCAKRETTSEIRYFQVSTKIP